MGSVPKGLKDGGARADRAGPVGDVGSVIHGRRTSESDGTVQVSQLLDPRLQLTPRQRATGNCYGAYAEAVQSGDGSEFLRERVDASSGSAGGMTERKMDMLRMVEAAQRAVRRMDVIRYRLGTARGDKAVGRHAAISPLALLDGVCLHGKTLEAIGRDKGWTVEREDAAKRRRMVMPDRQRKHLAEALREVLDAVHEAWDSRGHSIPWDLMTLDVR